MKVLRRTLSLLRYHTKKMSSQTKDVAGMRKPYKGEQDIFDMHHLSAKEPIGQFTDWFNTACETEGILEPNAMALATASKDGVPSVRMVLLKGYDKTGFKFYTNHESKKGQEMACNPNVSLMFYWESLLKMIRIDGMVERLSDEESTEYFNSRPRSSQIGALVSRQSTVIPGRQVLNERNSELLKEYADETVHIPKPEYWGGYKVVPHAMEFWQGQTNRLHDRILFRRPRPGEQIDSSTTHQGEDGWMYERLSP